MRLQRKKNHSAFLPSCGGALSDSFACGCRFLYVVGIQSTRIEKRILRRAVRFWRPFVQLVRTFYFISAGKKLLRLRRSAASLRNRLSAAGRRLTLARRKGLFYVFREFFSALRGAFAACGRFFPVLLKAAAPVLSVLLLAGTVRYWSRRAFGLCLTNGGRQVAVIRDESIYEKAAEMVRQRMVHDSAKREDGVKFAPEFRLSKAGGTGFATAASVCDLLIRQSDGIIEEASGLYVDGELAGAVKNSADLRYLLQSRLDAARGGDSGAQARFVRNVEVVNGLFPTTSIVETKEMEKKINGVSKSGATYLVRPGDTVSSIAKANRTTVEELNKINGKTLGDSIHPGDLITLEVAVPNLGVELIKTVTYEKAVPYATVTQNDETRETGYTRVLSEGTNGRQRCVDRVHLVNGTETARESVSRKVLVQPVSRTVAVGTKKRQNEKGVPSGKLIWPVPSLHTITTYFTWRWGSFHYGIDISGSGAFGRTIVAADGGTVEQAGWNSGGYGNCVLLSHGNGMETRYGHCSRVLVSAGQKVAKGQAIAQIGSTGYSTGPHLHFEVIRNGTKMDPLKYVS